MSRLLAALALAASCAGCILLAPSSADLGASCGFRGRDTECGKCLASSCDAEIAASCGDDAVMTPLEQCAADGTAACSALPAPALASCLAAHCASRCYEKSGASRTSCSDSFLAPGLACSCQLSDTAPNDTKCSSEVYPRTLCCAPFAWPGAGLECTCNAVACFPTSDGCNCALTDNLDGTESQECAGPAHCCATADHCQCRNRACSPNEKEVASCTKAALTCPVGQKQVAACAIRR